MFQWRPVHIRIMSNLLYLCLLLLSIIPSLYPSLKTIWSWEKAPCGLLVDQVLDTSVPLLCTLANTDLLVVFSSCISSRQSLTLTPLSLHNKLNTGESNWVYIIIIYGASLKITAVFSLFHTHWIRMDRGGPWVSISFKLCRLFLMHSQSWKSMPNSTLHDCLLFICMSGFSSRYKPLEAREHALFILYPIFSYCPWDTEGI